MNSEPLYALLPIVEALRALDVAYAIGGSMASSVFGEPRSTADIDILAELRGLHVSPFVTALADSFYVHEDAVRDAVRRRGSFNLLHQDTMCKVDVFVAGDDLLDREQLARRRPVAILDDVDAFDVTAPENIVLRKLAWYRAGGGVSDHQWRDILGVLKHQRRVLDHEYMRSIAEAAGLRDLLDRAISDAGD